MLNEGNITHRSLAPGDFEGGDGGTRGPDSGMEDADFVRPENEDDDGYDPYSDRRPLPEPLFGESPWD